MPKDLGASRPKRHRHRKSTASSKNFKISFEFIKITRFCHIVHFLIFLQEKTFEIGPSFKKLCIFAAQKVVLCTFADILRKRIFAYPSRELGTHK